VLVAMLRGWRLPNLVGREPLNPTIPSSAIMTPVAGSASGAGQCDAHCRTAFKNTVRAAKRPISMMHSAASLSQLRIASPMACTFPQQLWWVSAIFPSAPCRDPDCPARQAPTAHHPTRRSAPARSSASAACTPSAPDPPAQPRQVPCRAPALHPVPAPVCNSSRPSDPPDCKPTTSLDSDPNANLDPTLHRPSTQPPALSK